MAISKSAQQRLFTYLQVSNELSRRYQQDQEKKAEEQKRAADYAAEAAQALVENERIFEDQKEEVQEKIASDPVGAILLLRDTAKHRNANELNALGKLTEEKQAKSRSGGTAIEHVLSYDETPGGEDFRRRILGDV